MLGIDKRIQDGGSDSLQIRVLIVEDQPEVARALQVVIERDGMGTRNASTGAAAMDLIATYDPHVVLVDLGLPDTSGMGLIRRLVDLGTTGIIVVSGHSDETDKIVALELGADDYIVKPPSPKELVARIHAVHRRAKLRQPATAHVVDAEPDPIQVATIGDAYINLQKWVAKSEAGDNINLTAAEFTVLEVLHKASGQPVARERLFEAALHRPMHQDDRAIDQLIYSLRQKLTTGKNGRNVIQSVRGLGYCLRRD